MVTQRSEPLCECPPVFETRFGGDSGQTPIEAISEALAAVSGKELRDLPPLYEFVETEPLEALFEGFERREASDRALFYFPYLDWNVFVRGDGRIRVCDATRSTTVGPVFERDLVPVDEVED